MPKFASISGSLRDRGDARDRNGRDVEIRPGQYKEQGKEKAAG
jgi:hypothetical protein